MEGSNSWSWTWSPANFSSKCFNPHFPDLSWTSLLHLPLDPPGPWSFWTYPATLVLEVPAHSGLDLHTHRVGPRISFLLASTRHRSWGRLSLDVVCLFFLCIAYWRDPTAWSWTCRVLLRSADQENLQGSLPSLAAGGGSRHKTTNGPKARKSPLQITAAVQQPLQPVQLH